MPGFKEINREANIIYHSILSKDYNKKMPYFKTENVNKTKKILQEIGSHAGFSSLLDLGCGTGFIIHIAKDLFDKVVGIDITSEMIKQVDLSFKNVSVEMANAECLPFPDRYFNVVTANSFLHHLDSIEEVAKEAHRVLKTKGVFCSLLDPNYYFWEGMKKTPDTNNPIVQREIDVIKKVVEDHKELGISEDILRHSEIWQLRNGGMDLDRVIQVFKSVGFRQVKGRYQWFLGQAGVSEEDEKVIDTYLQESLPYTKRMYKYFSIKALK